MAETGSIEATARTSFVFSSLLWIAGVAVTVSVRAFLDLAFVTATLAVIPLGYYLTARSGKEPQNLLQRWLGVPLADRRSRVKLGALGTPWRMRAALGVATVIYLLCVAVLHGAFGDASTVASACFLLVWMALQPLVFILVAFLPSIGPRAGASA